MGSDIHGNLPALNAVIEVAQKQNVDRRLECDGKPQSMRLLDRYGIVSK